MDIQAVKTEPVESAMPKTPLPPGTVITIDDDEPSLKKAKK